MQKTIDLLTNHFQEFTKELQQETNHYAEKMEEVFAGAEGELLQIELTELLEKLARKESRSEQNLTTRVNLKNQIQAKEIRLKELIDSIKDKLKSTHL